MWDILNGHFSRDVCIDWIHNENSHILLELTFQFVSTILNNKLKEEGTTVENAHIKSGKAEKV